MKKRRTDTSMKAICLISGGLDSCVSACIAAHEGYELSALSFNYGQLHARELKSAKNIVRALHIKNHIIFDINLQKFGGSSLFKTSAKKPKHTALKNIGKTIPSTYVPCRNTIFLSLALAYAETVDADAIYIGITATDYSGYPDCRPEYIAAYQNMANLATRRGIQGRPIHIFTPLLHLSKAEIIEKGKSLDAPFECTWSCYLGRNMACGICDSCQLRLKGFQEAGIQDPLTYRHYPTWYTLK